MSLIKQPFELDVNTTIKALVYGQPGVRKTSFALSSPAPLLLDFDGGIHRVDPHLQVPTVQVKNWQNVLDVFNEDLSPFKTIVIDTAGKLLDFMTAQIIEDNPKVGTRDGGLTIQGYGVRKTMFLNFLKRVSGMGKHLIFVAHEREEKDGEQKVIRPEIGGSSGGDLVKELDLVGYMQMIGNKNTISFEPTERYYGKNTCKLPAVLDLHKPLDTNTTNNQLTVIINQYQAALEERKKVAAEYNDLMELIKGNITEATDAKTLNEKVAWVVSIQHIWDSQMVARQVVQEMAKKLGLVLDKDRKYVKAKKATADAEA